MEWFAVGDWKRRANTVGGIDTVAPEDVDEPMNALLDDYPEAMTLVHVRTDFCKNTIRN
jgi:hypothetical protein